MLCYAISIGCGGDCQGDTPDCYNSCYADPVAPGGDVYAGKANREPTYLPTYLSTHLFTYLPTYVNAPSWLATSLFTSHPLIMMLIVLLRILLMTT